MAAYDRIGVGYAAVRRPDARIAARLLAALEGCGSLVNVGAGAGSYEPAGRTRLAVDPSRAMIAQRPRGAAPCALGVAEALPLADGAVDAAMATLTMHHWNDWRRGLSEMRRVSRRRVVLLTWDPAFADALWLGDYLPELASAASSNFGNPAELGAALPGASVETIPIPHDCSDGFLGAYWRQPSAYLDARIRAGISVFAYLPEAYLAGALQRLAEDLASGAWEARYGALRDLDALDLGYRLIVWER